MQNAKLLLVHDDPKVAQALHQVLDDYPQKWVAKSAQEALRLARETRPDLVLLGAELGGQSSLELCRALKTGPDTAGIPILLLTRDASRELETQAVAAGVSDFISLPPRELRVLARLRTHLRLKGLSEHVRALTLVDEATGLANRRAFEDALALEWKRALRVPAPLSLLRVELDFFDQLVAGAGQAAAGRALETVGQILGTSVRRPGDLVAHLDGPSFALLLPHTEIAGALVVAENLRSLVRRAAIARPPSSAGAWVSLRIGVASVDAATGEWLALGHYFVAQAPEQAPTEQALLQAAEQALAQAAPDSVNASALDAPLPQSPPA